MNLKWTTPFTLRAAAATGFAALLAAGCAADGQPQDGRYDPDAVGPALESMSADSLLENIRVLSSDEFEGRGPGTPGEERTVAFLIDRFQRLGLQPGHPDGGWTQAVTLVGLRATRDASIVVDGQPLALRFPDDYVAMTRRVTPRVTVEDSDIVFVGYGVVAPEYDWDDYKGIDVTGKTLVMLVNDPAVPHPDGSGELDPDMFRGEAMTYYGRWTYKYEIATEKGAAAAIIIHDTQPAGYPYDVVRNSWGGENFDIKPADDNMGRVAIESWIHHDTAERLFSAAGLSLDSLKQAATRRDFQPVALNAQASFDVRNEIREIGSRNVIAKLEGARAADETIIYTAHWDHFGIGEPDATGDSIYSGALDNATGTAGLIEVARAFVNLPQPPDRTILFLAVTAEEQGLLGAKHYATEPLYPLEKTLANINMDGLNQWGRTNDITVIGMGNTTLEDILAEEVTARGRRVEPDPEPEKGFFYRSDHFEFAKMGVPALYTDAGIDYVGRPPEWGMMRRGQYTAQDYHKPSDQIKPDWDLTGAIDDLQLFFLVGLRVANGTAWPEWREGTEFRARRVEMLGGRTAN